VCLSAVNQRSTTVREQDFAISNQSHLISLYVPSPSPLCEKIPHRVIEPRS